MPELRPGVEPDAVSTDVPATAIGREAAESLSGDSFHVLVRWKVTLQRASMHRNASRPIRMTRPCTCRR